MDARFVPMGIVSGILLIISLVVTFLQQIIGLIAFLTTAIKLTMIFGFVGLMLFVGLLAFRTFRERRREKE